MLPTMYIIDRYLLRQFVQTFVICFLSLFGLFVIIEISANLHAFVESGEKSGGVISFIAHFYAYKSLSFFDVTGSFLSLVSAMFTASWLQRHNEMTALMAAGISRIRAVLPIIAAVVVVSLISAANRELVIPRYRDELSRKPQDPLGDRPESLSPCLDNEIDVQLGGKCTVAEPKKKIVEPCFLMRATEPARVRQATGRRRGVLCAARQ